MLLGNFQHGFDKKGRIIIPSKFRADLGERFIATKGVDNCITIYPVKEWIEFEAKIKALPSTKDSRAFSRFFFSGAAECEVDKQGRVLIPSHLREYARIEKDAVINGASSHVEIWSMEDWQAYMDSDLLSPESIAEKMESIGGI